jgi:hypothetical protein
MQVSAEMTLLAERLPDDPIGPAGLAIAPARVGPCPKTCEAPK